MEWTLSIIVVCVLSRLGCCGGKDWDLGVGQLVVVRLGVVEREVRC